MNRMFLSFLNSMQTNSQDAQNPGLWVNGNRMPMQEQNRLDPTRSLANQLFPAVNARENEAAAKASFVNKANKIGAEGISPYFGQNNPEDPANQIPQYPLANWHKPEAARVARLDQEIQNTQAYGAGKNMRWVDPAGVMHRGTEESSALEQELDRNSPIMRAEISNVKPFAPYGGVGMKSLNKVRDDDDKHVPKTPRGYNPYGSQSNFEGGAYSIIDNPNASYGTDDPITRGIRATRSNTTYQQAVGGHPSFFKDAKSDSLLNQRGLGSLNDKIYRPLGYRMPMQEGKGPSKELMVGGIGGMSVNLDGLGRGAGAAARANISQQVRAGNAQLNNPARLNVQRLEREDAKSGSNPFIYNPLVNVVDAEIELMAKQIARGNLSGGRGPGAMQPEPMQENTKRSMFLTHLQGMQTKSQDAQNPGLWVNGNRMPMQEQQGAPIATPPSYAPYRKGGNDFVGPPEESEMNPPTEPDPPRSQPYGFQKYREDDHTYTEPDADGGISIPLPTRSSSSGDFKVNPPTNTPATNPGFLTSPQGSPQGRPQSRYTRVIETPEQKAEREEQSRREHEEMKRYKMNPPSLRPPPYRWQTDPNNPRPSL